MSESRRPPRRGRGRRPSSASGAETTDNPYRDEVEAGSATLSVPGRFWCYTQLGADGEPLQFVAAFAGSPSALEALDVRSGPARWVTALESLRPDLELDPAGAQISTWAEDPWARGAYSAASATAPIETETLAAAVGPLAFAGEHTAGDFVLEFSGMTQSAVSQHLKVLREVNLVKVRVDGAKRHYSLVPETLSEVDQWIARYRHFWPARLDALAKHLNRKPR